MTMQISPKAQPSEKHFQLANEISQLMQRHDSRNPVIEGLHCFLIDFFNETIDICHPDHCKIILPLMLAEAEAQQIEIIDTQFEFINRAKKQMR